MTESKFSKAPKKFTLLGQGALAADILDVHPDAGCINFFVEEEFYNPSKYIIKNIPTIFNFSDVSTPFYLLGVGDNTLRKQFINTASQNGLSPFPALTSQARFISPYTSIGEGTVFGFNTIIERNVSIGQHCLLMHNVMISHDVTIGSNVIIAPGVIIEGNAMIGDNVFIGANVSIAPNVKIGSNCHIALGSACFKNVPESKTVIGNPAKVIQTIKPLIS